MLVKGPLVTGNQMCCINHITSPELCIQFIVTMLYWYFVVLMYNWFHPNASGLLSWHCAPVPVKQTLNTLRLRQNYRHFAEDIFKCICVNKNVWILLKISLKFVPRVLTDNIPALVQIMACRLVGAKPLSEAMLFSLLTHICITRP